MFLARFNFDGTTDDSFGTDGLVVTDLGVTDGDRGRVGVFMRAVGLQSNGDIVVVGSTRKFPAQSSIVARFLPGGSLDSSFGNNGTVENELARRLVRWRLIRHLGLIRMIELWPRVCVAYRHVYFA